jgi:osmotically-inducible protein OsmY
MITDHKLKVAAIAELDWEPSIEANHIGVAVEGGVVTLTGYVKSYLQKSQAERAVGRISGVKGLAEELEVRLPGHMRKGDDEIAQAALHRLSSDIAIPKDAVRVKVQKGWVTLSGEVFALPERGGRSGGSVPSRRDVGLKQRDRQGATQHSQDQRRCASCTPPDLLHR